MQDRRAHYRISKLHRALFSDSQGNSVVAEIQDLSLGGARIVVKQGQFPEGQSVRLIVQIGRSEFLSAVCSPVRRSSEDIGVKFESPISSLTLAKALAA